MADEEGRVLWTGNTRKTIGRRQRTIKRQEISIGPVTLRFVTIVVLALLILIYLVQSTKGSSQQIQMTSLDQKKATLESEQKEIELEAVRLKALQGLKDTAKNFNLEPVKSAENMTNTNQQ